MLTKDMILTLIWGSKVLMAYSFWGNSNNNACENTQTSCSHIQEEMESKAQQTQLRNGTGCESEFFNDFCANIKGKQSNNESYNQRSNSNYECQQSNYLKGTGNAPCYYENTNEPQQNAYEQINSSSLPTVNQAEAPRIVMVKRNPIIVKPVETRAPVYVKKVVPVKEYEQKTVTYQVKEEESPKIRYVAPKVVEPVVEKIQVPVRMVAGTSPYVSERPQEQFSRMYPSSSSSQKIMVSNQNPEELKGGRGFIGDAGEPWGSEQSLMNSSSPMQGQSKSRSTPGTPEGVVYIPVKTAPIQKYVNNPPVPSIPQMPPITIISQPPEIVYKTQPPNKVSTKFVVPPNKPSVSISYVTIKPQTSTYALPPPPKSTTYVAVPFQPIKSTSYVTVAPPAQVITSYITLSPPRPVQSISYVTVSPRVNNVVSNKGQQLMVAVVTKTKTKMANCDETGMGFSRSNGGQMSSSNFDREIIGEIFRTEDQYNDNKTIVINQNNAGKIKERTKPKKESGEGTITTGTESEVTIKTEGGNTEESKTEGGNEIQPGGDTEKQPEGNPESPPEGNPEINSNNGASGGENSQTGGSGMDSETASPLISGPIRNFWDF